MNSNEDNKELLNENMGKDFVISVSEDKMSAYITFATRDNINKGLILNALSSKNIIFGIDEDFIDIMLGKIELGKEYLIAKGKESIHGKDGYVDYFFKTSKDFEPDVDESGNINFKSLNIVSSVSEGDKLAKIYFPSNGEDGTDVFGKVSKGRRGLNPIIVFDDASVEKTEDGTLISKIAGAVRLAKGKIFVENQFTVKGDVGPASGNINFNGNVIVTGNVLTDYEVRATGDIEIKGSIEGGSIYTEGNLIVQKGIIGMEKGRVEVEGFLHSKYIQSCEVVCNDSITAESLLYCDVRCKKTITVSGRKGVINGGNYKAATLIDVRQLGSHMCTKTNVEVGVDPELIDEYKRLKTDIKEVATQIEKLNTITEAFSKIKESLPPAKKQMLLNAIDSKSKLKSKLSQDTYDFQRIEEIIERASGGAVIVRNTAYPGAIVHISECSYHVNEELKGLKFVKKKGDIVIESI